MPRLLALLCAAVLIPAAAAAQRPRPDQDAPGAQRSPSDLGAIKQAPPLTTRISQHAAVTAALARVRSDLAAGRLSSWGGGQGGGIKPSVLAAAEAVFNRTAPRAALMDLGARAGIYVVAVTAPGATGHVRVVVDAATGEVLSSKLGAWDWGNAPAWWQAGADAPPRPSKGLLR